MSQSKYFKKLFVLVMFRNILGREGGKLPHSNFLGTFLLKF